MNAAERPSSRDTHPRTSRAQTLLGVGILIILLAGAGLIVWMLISWFRSVDSDTGRAALGAAASIAVAALTVTITKILETRRQVQSELRELYRESYDKFTRMLFGLMRAQRDARPGQAGKVRPDQVQAMEEFGRSLVLEGSDAALKMWAEWRSTDWEAANDHARMMRHLIQIMLQMRRDFGHRNKSLTPADIAAIFLQPDAVAMVLGDGDDDRGR